MSRMKDSLIPFGTMMNHNRNHRIIFLFMIFSLGVSGAWCTPLWKDDFSDDLMFELTWDTKMTTGTPTLANNSCILNTDPAKGQMEEALISHPSYGSLPPNFDLFSAVEFTNVKGNEGEFYVNVGGRMELVVSFQEIIPQQDENKTSGKKLVYVLNPKTRKCLFQNTGILAQFAHKITSGERCFITWMSNGLSPSLHTIKMGTGPDKSDIADFIIETPEPISGRVSIGIRKGLKEVRLKYVNAYPFAPSSTRVHEWVLF